MLLANCPCLSCRLALYSKAVCCGNTKGEDHGDKVDWLFSRKGKRGESVLLLMIREGNKWEIISKGKKKYSIEEGHKRGNQEGVHEGTRGG